MQKITPFLWFNDNAEEAMNFYTSIFNDAKIINVTRNGEAGPGPNGSVLTATIQLAGQDFMVLNGGPMFKFTEAVSFFVNCKDQAEVDYFWNTFIENGGQASQCGWLKDKYGLSWQIIPEALGNYLRDKDPKKAKNVMQAMMQMTKIDVKKLEEAHEK